MLTEEKGIEIKVSKKKYAQIIFGNVLGIGLILAILNFNSSISEGWLWFWNILCALYLLFATYVLTHPSVITISKKGIRDGEKLYEWKRIEYAFLKSYNNKYHSVLLNIVFRDEKGVSQEANIDLTNYVYSWGEVMSAIDYWRKEEATESNEKKIEKEAAYLPLLSVLEKESKHEEELCNRIQTAIFIVLLLISMGSIEYYSHGSRGYTTLVITLTMFASFSVALCFSSIIMKSIQRSFMSKPPMTSLSKDERDELMEIAKIHKCKPNNWDKWLWITILITAICVLALIATIKFGKDLFA